MPFFGVPFVYMLHTNEKIKDNARKFEFLGRERVEIES